MAAKAYLTDKLIHLVFDAPGMMQNVLRDPTATYKPGCAMISFLRTDTAKISGQYDKIIFKLIKITDGNISADRENWLAGIFESAKTECPYINYYTLILVEMLLSVVKGVPFDAKPIFKQFPDAAEMYERYKKKYEKSAAKPEKVLAYYYAPEYIEACQPRQRLILTKSLYNVLFIKETLIKDIDRRKKALSEDLAFLFNTNAENLSEDLSEGEEFSDEAISEGMSSMSRLILLEASKRSAEGNAPVYIGRRFTASYEPAFSESNLFAKGLFKQADAEKTKDADSLQMTEEYLEENKITAREFFDVDKIDDLIALELLKVIESRTMIKRCENCGLLFVPSGRADAIYCANLFEDTEKTCAEIGAAKKFKDKIESNPIKDAYTKAYKRNDSRVRNEKMTKEEFKDWVLDARKKRTECMDGKISLEEFTDWLGNKK